MNLFLASPINQRTVFAPSVFPEGMAKIVTSVLFLTISGKYFLDILSTLY
jgi:hypothetical protein